MKYKENIPTKDSPATNGRLLKKVKSNPRERHSVVNTKGEQRVLLSPLHNAPEVGVKWLKGSNINSTDVQRAREEPRQADRV